MLYWDPNPYKYQRSNFTAHRRVMEASANKHDILYFNVLAPPAAWIRKHRWDAAILHTSFWSPRFLDTPGFEEWRRKLGWVRDLDCLKIAMPQDEYDFSELLDEWLDELKVAVIFSVFDEPLYRLIYTGMSGRAVFRKCMTGYIDEPAMARARQFITPYASRAMDVVYRARNLPFQFGSQGQLKSKIAGAASSGAAKLGLKCDISTKMQDTIYGEKWLKFLADGKCTIGCESGVSVLNRRGEIKRQVGRILRSSPYIEFEALARQMPPGWDDYKFFALGPRHLEAAATMTLQILVEGRYDGALEPGRHYIPIKRDFSDMDEALEKIADVDFAEKMIRTAHEEVYLSGKHSYSVLAAQIEDAINEFGVKNATSGILPALPWGISKAIAAAQEIDGIFTYHGIAALRRITQNMTRSIAGRCMFGRNWRAGIEAHKLAARKVIVFRSARPQVIRPLLPLVVKTLDSDVLFACHESRISENLKPGKRITPLALKENGFLFWDSLGNGTQEALRNFGADIVIIPTMSYSLGEIVETYQNIWEIARAIAPGRIIFVTRNGEIIPADWDSAPAA